ncbi:SGNH/GDSL hydrolase family protein [Niveispirillum sp. KHB5.9]|uniref:SGNH/GDSL hydrolase family protein n=1 Tax=Niveispirillum sp. KHB5.9 TaxID=3400269 RepID=UPI003A883C69
MPPLRHHSVLAGLFALLVMAMGAPADTLPVGAKYVALGSSYASGPGLPPYVADAPARCGRSTRNYAHLLAARRSLTLVDATCSGATTAAVLVGWNELPAQVEAVDADTRLVTVTIGGNNLRYIGNLMSQSCLNLAARTGGPTDKCVKGVELKDGDLEAAYQAMRAVADAVRRRAPSALLIFVDYSVVLPPTGICAATPLTPKQADQGRKVADQLALVTARVASDSGALLVKASSLSAGHDACAADPWMTGYPGPPGTLAYHLTADGMAAVARGLDGALDIVAGPAPH